MKKFLSIILTAMLIVGMLPTAFAAVDAETGVITYSFSGGVDGVSDSKDNAPIETLDGTKIYTEYDATDGRYWAYLGTNLVTANGAERDSYLVWCARGGSLRTGNSNVELKQDTWVAFKINVPCGADYKVTGDMFKHKYCSKTLGIYIAPFEKVKETFENGDTYGKGQLSEDGVSYERTGGTEFERIGIEGYKLCELSTYQQSSSSTANYTIKDFISLEAGEYVLVFHNGSEKGHIAPKTITLTPMEAVTDAISFVATSNVGEEDMMEVEADGFVYDEFTDSIPAGTFVTVTAPQKTGYEFKHWVRGSADNGVYVSDNPVYTFTALTHTFLTAIYENVSNENDDTATVEFYNGNGQYLDKATSTIGGTVSIPETVSAPTLTGFEFANEWKTEDGVFNEATPLTRKLTRAVAQFNTPNTTFKVTCGEEEVPLTYGSKHTFTSNNPVYWMRKGAVLGYGETYTYAAWDATKITTSETGELIPVVLLDADAKDGARMIEYNTAGKNVIEVGIVFGDEDVNIGSCTSKATSQYKNQHGQFTAKPYGEETVARGYMIYEDNGTYRVIYSK